MLIYDIQGISPSSCMERAPPSNSCSSESWNMALQHEHHIGRWQGVRCLQCISR